LSNPVSTSLSGRISSIVSNESWRFYYIYETNKYNVTLFPNGTNGNGTTAQILYGSKYTIPKCTFSRAGYTFKNWNTKADGTGTSYVPGSSFIWNNTNDLNLYAQWSLNIYTVSFNANGGSGTINSLDVSYSFNISLPSSGFTMQGFVLKCWNTDPNGNGIDYQLGEMYTQSTTSNVTFYAVWEEIIQDINKTSINRFASESQRGEGGRLWSNVSSSEIISYTPQSTNTIQKWEKLMRTKNNQI
jgi:hypothetical protein ELI_1175